MVISDADGQQEATAQWTATALALLTFGSFAVSWNAMFLGRFLA